MSVDKALARDRELRTSATARPWHEDGSGTRLRLVGPLPRSRQDDHLSGLSAHPLIVQEHLAEDTVLNGEGGQLISSAHKFGGRAYCVQEPELQGAEALLDSGYVQALQLDFPGSADATVSGDWPFADGIFNLFMHPDESHPVYWAFQR